MIGAASLAEFVGKLDAPRHVWIMVPAAFVDATIASLVPLLARGDTIIDGGNSWYHDDIKRAQPLAADHGIDYVDVGTSGGVHGLERGYCLMVGGPDAAIERLAPIFDTLAPGVDAAPSARPTLAARGDAAVDRRAGLAALRPERRRPLREDGPQRHRVRADGGLRRGPQRARQGQHRRRDARRPTPRRRRSTDPQYYQYDLDLAAIAEVWRRGLGDRQLAARPDRRRARRRSPADARTRAASATPARGAGRSRRPSTRACRCRCCRRRCSSGSAPGAGPTSPTRCCRRCGPGSAGTSRGRSSTR